jgi:hypothetical protein
MRDAFLPAFCLLLTFYEKFTFLFQILNPLLLVFGRLQETV